MSPLTEPTKLTLAKSFTWNETVWNPSMIQTALWLDANDASTINATSGAVNQWSDKSGNARHATASTTARPTYSATSFNAKPGLTFNGTSNILRADQTASIATGNDVPFSVFYVANIQASNQTKTSMGFGRALTSNDLHNFSFDGSNFYQSFRRDTALAINSIAGASSAASANNIFSDVFTGTSATKYLNGNLYASGTLNVGTLILDQFGIGGLPVFNAVLEYISMTCSEILIIANAASQSTQQRIEGYLAWKWGLTANLPAGHPYKTVGPTP